MVFFLRFMKYKFMAVWLSLFMILVFALQSFVEGFTEMFLLNDFALSGEVYRFVSSVFLHGSLAHLILNLFALILFGLILEKFVGWKVFLVVFFSSGILANVVSVFFYDASLGASGAIFGVIGCLTIIKPKMYVWALGFPLPMFLAAFLWILIDVVRTFTDTNVGTIAHLSGIFVGFVFGFFLKKNFIGVQERKLEVPEIPERYAKKWEEVYMR